MRRTASLALALGLSLAFAGCGGDDEENPVIDARVVDAAAIDGAAIDGATVDAAPNDGRVDDAAVDATPDAPAATGVTEVSCAGATIASEVTAPNFMAFAVSVSTIPVNGIARFTMPAIHSAVSGTALPGDGKFVVGVNQIKCLRFTIAGTYPFVCNPHGFPGSLTVGP